jgi:hypothetical protein
MLNLWCNLDLDDGFNIFVKLIYQIVQMCYDRCIKAIGTLALVIVFVPVSPHETLTKLQGEVFKFSIINKALMWIFNDMKLFQEVFMQLLTWRAMDCL